LDTIDSLSFLRSDAADVYNDAGANIDLRFEGDTDTNLLFLDASADKVGIGTGGPLSKLSVGGVGSSAYTIYGSGGTTHGIGGYGSVVGVYGESANYGVVGVGSVNGVYGSGPSGVYGSGTSYGVDGYSAAGTGVRGYGSNYGVYGLGGNYDFYGTGRAYFGANVTSAAFLYSSDIRLKENITLINNSLDKIKQLEGINFNWKNSSEFSMGLIAQDVEKVFPEIVGTDAEGYKSVQYGNLIAPAIEAIKELDEKDEGQDTEIEELRKEIELLRAEVSALSGNATLEDNKTDLIENKEVDTSLESEGNVIPQNRNFFSKYFYTLFNNMF